jgi:peroxiredoxin
MKKYFYVALLIMSLCTLSACSRKESPALEGKPAPDFTLKDMSGKQVRLSDLKGKVVMLNFWATWCPPCREEIPSMFKLNSLMAGKPFQMLAVSIDEGGEKVVSEFFKGAGATLPVLLDTDNAVSRRYGTTGVPETFIVDSKGVILKKVVGGMDWSSPEVVGFFDEAIKNSK